MPVSFALSVTIPEDINADVSFSSVASALEGEADTTLWMCLFTRILRSSLETLKHGEMSMVALETVTHTGTRNGSPLNRGKTWT